MNGTETRKIPTVAAVGTNGESIENNIPVMLSIKEAAAKTGLSYYFVRLLAINGKIPAVRAGNYRREGKIYVNYSGLLDYLSSATITEV